MKAFLSFAFLLFAVVVLSGQEIRIPISEKLDERNGFKEFTFGDPFSKYKGRIFESDSDGHSKSYMFESIEKDSLFGFEFDYLSLEFYDGKLSNISISFERQGLYFFERLESKLEELFGTATRAPDRDQSEPFSIWAGENVLMNLSLQIMKFGIDDTREMVFLRIESRKIKRAADESDF